MTPLHSDPPTEAVSFRIFELHAVQLSLAAFLLVADYACGPVISFPIFFVIPVVLAAWSGNTRTAFALAFGQPLIRFAFRFLWVDVPWSATTSAVNLVIRISLLTLIAYLVCRTAKQTRELAREVKLLEGILPICSHCKRICDKEQEWQQLETYIAEHSAADFSHGICPPCADKHYGDLLARGRKARA